MDLTNAKGQEWQCAPEACNIRSRIDGISHGMCERNQAMQHIKAEVCAKKGEIQKFHLHSSSSNEEFLAQDPICN